jgi:hypothetical protein
MAPARSAIIVGGAGRAGLALARAVSSRNHSLLSAGMTAGAENQLPIASSSARASHSRVSHFRRRGRPRRQRATRQWPAQEWGPRTPLPRVWLKIASVAPSRPLPIVSTPRAFGSSSFTSSSSSALTRAATGTAGAAARLGHRGHPSLLCGDVAVILLRLTS